jgi:hypothetical protein
MGPARTAHCLGHGRQALKRAKQHRASLEMALLELDSVVPLRPPAHGGLGDPGSGLMLAWAGESRVARWFSFRAALFAWAKRSYERRRWLDSRMRDIEDNGNAGLTSAVEAYHYLYDASLDVPAAVPIMFDGDSVEPIDSLVGEAHTLVHLTADVVGGVVGCQMSFDKGAWFLECKCDLMHIRLGNSMGFTSRRLCGVCRSDVGDCKHVLGKTYPVLASQSGEGMCTICGAKSCEHEVGTTYSVPVHYVLDDIQLLDLSLVDRPRDPLARITAREMTSEVLIASLGRMPMPDETVLHHECMYQCTGFREPRIRKEPPSISPSGPQLKLFYGWLSSGSGRRS